jgi:hypothetical protein
VLNEVVCRYLEHFKCGQWLGCRSVVGNPDNHAVVEIHSPDLTSMVSGKPYTACLPAC